MAWLVPPAGAEHIEPGHAGEQRRADHWRPSIHCWMAASASDARCVVGGCLLGAGLDVENIAFGRPCVICRPPKKAPEPATTAKR